MPLDLVVDIGNTRVKWGRCLHGAVIESTSLPQDDEDSWDKQIKLWNLSGKLSWACAGVEPDVAERFSDWARHRGDRVVWLESWHRLPIEVKVDHPERVGMDRLLNALAGRHRAGQGVPVILVDVGTAVTVDYVDESGAFRGGAIAPGFRLMGQALHDHTARLPLVGQLEGGVVPSVPGTSTMDAIRAGIFWTCAGGIELLMRELQRNMTAEPRVFLTGGDATLVAPALDGKVQLWPFMTLEGIRIAAEGEALPQ